MRTLSLDELLVLARSKTLEEFMIAKDLLGFHGRKFCQKHSIEILSTMAAQHHDSKFACSLIASGKHFTLGRFNVSFEMFDRWYKFAGQPYIKHSLHDIWLALHMFDPPF